MSSRTLSTPEQLQDYCIGKAIYRRGGFIEECANEVQRRGFSNMASRSLGCSWGVFNDAPQQAIRFSESAFAEVAYRNERNFQGVDYSEPSLQ